MLSIGFEADYEIQGLVSTTTILELISFFHAEALGTALCGLDSFTI